jgi:hypothetical protein
MIKVDVIKRQKAAAIINKWYIVHAIIIFILITIRKKRRKIRGILRPWDIFTGGRHFVVSVHKNYGSRKCYSCNTFFHRVELDNGIVLAQCANCGIIHKPKNW